MSRVPAAEALRRLRDGNARFAANTSATGTLITAARRAKLLAAQEPFAIVLGCSDSRVPAEIVFDQGLGDLFVIRVAGNIVAPSQIGSVEFAAEQFHTRLVVVLGHSGCGAILATIDQLKRPVDKQSRNLRRQAFQALGFNVGFFGFWGLLSLLAQVPFLGFSAWVLVPLLAPLFLVASVYYGIKTWNGDDVRIPIVTSWIDERMPKAAGD